MNILIIASQYNYPANGGLFEMTHRLLLATASGKSTIDFIFYGAIDEKDQLTEEIKNLGSKLNIYNYSLTKSWLAQNIRITYLPKILLDKTEKKIIAALEIKKYDVCILEGLGAAGYKKYIQSTKIFINLIDPPLLRNKRLLKKATNLKSTAHHLLKIAISFVIEKKISSYTCPINLVSPTDAKWFSNRYKKCDVINIPICLEPEFESKPSNSNWPVKKIIVFIDLSQKYILPDFIKFFNCCIIELSKKYNDISINIICRKIPDITHDCKNVKFTPWVDNIDKEINNSDIIILPDATGTGLKNRTIRSLGHGKTVIGTKYAFEGIPVLDEDSALIYKNNRDFLEKIDLALNSKFLMKKLSENAEKLVAEQYSYASFCKSIQGLIHDN